jgi:hypothetical protein
MLLVLVMMLAEQMVDRNSQDVILPMPSLLRVMNPLKEFFVLERGQRGAHLMFGNTLPRKRRSLRIMGRHIYNSGLIATLRNASTGADVRVIMGQLVFGRVGL